jgi:hypothetical protein
MSYLLGRQPHQYYTSRPISVCEATERLKGLTAEKQAFVLKRKQLASERKNEDMKHHLFRKEEYEKYNAALASWRREDEQIREKRVLEDNVIAHDEGVIGAEIVSVLSAF